MSILVSSEVYTNNYSDHLRFGEH